MDRTIWFANNKAPAPIAFTAKRRTHLNTKYEHILWFCTQPEFCLADNRRVLLPHSEQMKKLIRDGGEKTTRTNAEGKYKIKKGNFSNKTVGKIPGNILEFGTTCSDSRKLKVIAETLGLPKHGATFPVALAKHIVKWLCPIGGLAVDPFGGYSTLGQACEETDRRWITCDTMWEYAKVSLLRFKERKGYYVNHAFDVPELIV